MKSKKWLTTVFVTLIAAIFAMAFLTFIINAQSQQKVKFQPKKFEVTYTVTYNAVTLEEAVALEQLTHETYKNPCKIDVQIKEAAQGTSATGIFLYQNNRRYPNNSIAVDTLTVDTLIRY